MAEENSSPVSVPRKNDVERDYRALSTRDLEKYRVVVGESDLWIQSDSRLDAEISRLLKFYRRQLKEYIHQYPIFRTTLSPYPEDLAAPEIVQWMITVSAMAGVGPMAAVAGAIAGMIGRQISCETRELIIENGGDIYLRSGKERIVGLYAGNSPFTGKIGLLIPPTPLAGMGICTSAGTIGPSLSLGKADAAVIMSPDPALADAVATQTGNLVQTVHDLESGLCYAHSIPEVTGVLIVKDECITAWGEIQIVPIASDGAK